MNPSSKLLIAAALVAGGYGLAALMGTPQPHRTSGGSYGGVTAQPSGPDAPAWTGSGSAVDGVRLLPVTGTEAPAWDASASTPGSAFTSTPGSSLPAKLTTGPADAAPAAAEAAASPPADILLRCVQTPRAKLGDVRSSGRPEPPAMVAVPAVDRFVAPPATQVASPSRQPVVDTSPAHQASYDWPAELWTPAPASARALAPVETPTDDRPAAVRIHVVIDGDSLARLAGRYLDDPHRGEDIYRLNRDVLSSPDLLPIGAELKIPVRTQSSEASRELSESRFGTAPQHGLVPVRPLPADAAAAMPQARLLQPQPAG